MDAHLRFGGAGWDHLLGLPLFCLLQAIAVLSSKLLKLPFFPSVSPHGEGVFPGCRNISSFVVLSQWGRSLPRFFFFYFLLPSYVEIILALLGF